MPAGRWFVEVEKNDNVRSKYAHNIDTISGLGKN